MNRSSQPKDARAVALQLLLARERESQYTEDLLADALAGFEGPPEDRALLQELTYGVVRWRDTLDWLIQLKTTPGRNQKAGLQNLLRLGLYQLFWLERIPDHAAVHETVRLAKIFGFGPQAGFVNAVLRGYLREREQTKRRLHELKTQEPALGYSHPRWLYDRWVIGWGAEQTAQLMSWNNTPPKPFARVNTLRIAPTDLAREWVSEGVDAEPVFIPWTAPGLIYELKTHQALGRLATFQRGLFYIQDPSTLLAVHALDPQPGESVLDLCSAPGGKTTYMAQRMQNQGRVVAGDTQPRRLELVRENCERLGVTCVTTVPMPTIGGLPPAFEGSYDRVLVDAPCSNTGVLRRRVDLRWRVRPEEIARLHRTQLDLLDEASRYVRVHGRLTYSTCSLEPEENVAVVQAFLQEHSNFERIGEEELRPFRDRVDGAYVASLTRKR